MTPFGKWKPIPMRRVNSHWERVRGKLDIGRSEPIEEVNNDVNHGWRYVREDVDYWQSPNEMMSSGEGDCEDFAILKMALIGRGELIIGHDNILGGNHAVLFVDGVVLDCTHDRLLTPDEMPHFKPIMGMDKSSQWVYGS